MGIPDTLTFMERNISFGSYYGDATMFRRMSLKRGPVQIDEDADIYYGYYHEKDEPINEE